MHAVTSFRPPVTALVLSFAAALAASCASDPGSGGRTVADAPFDFAPRGIDPHPSATPAAYPRPCHPLYAQESLPVLELEIAPATLSTLRAEAEAGIENWYPASFRHDGEEVAAHVRNRGNKKSCGGKLQLAISFNREDKSARFRGLRRLNLDTGHCRILDERLAFAFVREDLGIPAPCANHARLYVNGEYEGLFTNLEVQNKEFLKRNFGPAGDGGDLWKEGYYLKTNESDPEDRTRLDRLRHAGDLETVEALADLEFAVREWAMEAIVPATDNFWVDGWNYYLYEHPTRGFLWLPRDFDKALPWTDAWTFYDPIDTASQAPIPMVLADPYWRERYLAEVAAIVDRYDPDLFEARMDAWWAQVHDAAIADPTLGVVPGESPPSYLRDNIHLRAAWLQERMAALETGE